MSDPKEAIERGMVPVLLRRPCAVCRKVMAWGKLPGGKWIPLDPAHPVFTPIRFADWEEKESTELARNQLSFASHLPACPTSRPAPQRVS